MAVVAQAARKASESITEGLVLRKAASFDLMMMLLCCGNTVQLPLHC